MISALVSLLLVIAPPCTNDGHNQNRSRSAISAFKKAHPCPVNGKKSGACPGYVIDHICPLACCGKDTPANMQWQSKTQAKAKDKWELDCSLSCK